MSIKELVLRSSDTMTKVRFNQLGDHVEIEFLDPSNRCMSAGITNDDLKILAKIFNAWST